MAKMSTDSFRAIGIFPDDTNKYIKQVNLISQKQPDKSIKVDMVVIRFISED